MSDWIQENKKFVVALLGAIITTLATVAKKPIDDASATAIITGLFSVFVWLARNKPPAPPPEDPPKPLDIPTAVVTFQADTKPTTRADKRVVTPKAVRIARRRAASYELRRAHLRLVTWVLCGLGLVGCLNARDAHDVATLTIDSIQCVEQSPTGATAEEVAISCGIADVPDVLKLVVDLLVQRKAAERAGSRWTPIERKP